MNWRDWDVKYFRSAGEVVLFFVAVVPSILIVLGLIVAFTLGEVGCARGEVWIDGYQNDPRCAPHPHKGED